MAIEQIIERILAKHPEVSKEEISERLKKEKRRTSGFISEEALLRMIAAELGMETRTDGFVAPTLSVVDLVPSLSDATVVGRVVAIFPPKAFNGNRSGSFASFLIADENGIARVVMWNARTSLIESGSIKVGQIIRISHGYTKEGREGKVELHVGEKCSVEIDPPDLGSKSFPTISKFTTKINKLHDHGSKKVNIIGTVMRLFPVSAFERQDSSSGKVMRLSLKDETGEISVVAWNEKVDEIQAILKENEGLQIVNAKVKKTMGQELEVHVDSGTFVDAFVRDDEFLNVSCLTEGLAHVNVEGEVVTRPLVREVKTYKQETVRVASFELMDTTGKIWISAWGKHAGIADTLKLGDKVVLKNAYVRKGFGDQLELSTRDAASLTFAH
jgi:ssDNA-binding replication factor A large subunit